MKTLLLALSLSFLLFSCSDKSVLLPQIAISGETDIQNHTEVWVFYKEEEGKISADLNKNNTVTSTNWIINIDKRLPLSEVIPVFQFIKAKRSKKSIHRVEGMKDYLSYSNTLDEKIAVFPINDIQYLLLSKSEIDKINKDKICDYAIRFSSEIININNQEFRKKSWNKHLLENLESECVQLQFNSKLSYQEFLEYRLSVSKFLPKGVKIETTEYIYKE